ncbi:ATP-dependent zinc metalloprotease FtsH [Desulfosediminicola flagellatus]|uniref:ATP-dependent zinc metalloprotease FtsH n=1 Tax=Desulfosediminicola flagellatus TaxID=2569541 RepID=UPI0010AD541B|nr:ATP-dependent zinc metalloprotease FtsH [Desulfosediminicola flagellatus]
MAVLVRNLMIFSLAVFAIFLGCLFYYLDSKLPVGSYNQFTQDLRDGSVKALHITGSRIEVIPVIRDRYQTQVPDPQSILNQFDLSEVEIVFSADYTKYYYQVGMVVGVVIFAFVVFISTYTRRSSGEEQKFASERLMMPGDALMNVRFSDVAGIPEAREELEEVVTFLKEPGIFRAIGATIPRGMLLQGPPGTGKTLLARAIAGEAGVPFYSFSGSDFVEMFVGVGASRVRDLFSEAKQNAPCIVFIDEIDAVGTIRSAGATDGNDERGQTLNALLVEMDGFGSTDSILVLGATNRPDILDPALRRPGRFDRQITILPPDVKGRLDILNTHTRKVTLSEDVNIEEVAQISSGFTGAELASLVNEAALLAARKGQREIGRSHFDQARDRILLGVERKGMVLTNNDKKILAHHEAGHAIVAKMLPETDPIHKITIIPRGTALGQTQQLQLGDRYAYGKRYLMNRISTLLGGRAAEKMIFNEFTTQAESDLVQATEIATNMVCRWGMGESLGPQAYAVESGGFLNEGASRLTVSDETAHELDREIKQLLVACYNQALAILEREKYFLKVLSEILLQVETLDSEEFEIIYQCSLTKKAQKYGPKIDESECAVCPAKGQCLHS